MPIHILPEDVASQIAAGEVVERPASVVKELIENALDAGASFIHIRVKDAGRELIQVSDNGSGIPAEELALSVARHATSKLQSAADLYNIQTLGFRGEALASIGSVSRMTITSRAKDADIGARMLVEAGNMRHPQPAGAPVGTDVLVEDLFFNVPARLKFLKKNVTEKNHINELVIRYALAYPHVRWHLFQDDQAVLQTSGNGSRREVLGALYGTDMAGQMLEVTLEDGEMKVEGFISPITLTRSNRKEITFFVNGRWVQDLAMTSALLKAYHTLLMVGRYPFVVLSLEILPGDVDVNVHPAKAEVRFRDTSRIFSIVQRAVRRALLAYSPVPQVPPYAWRPAQSVRQIDPAWEMHANQPDIPASGEDTILEIPIEPGQLAPAQIPLLRLIGQIGAAYLVAEGPDGLYLIDQHAAHERVLFEKFQRMSASGIVSQALLDAPVFHLSPQSVQSFAEQLPVLNRIGFQVEEFGPATYRITAIPGLLTGSDPVAAVRSAIESFEEDEAPLQGEIENRLIARICKRAAVKAGQVLSTEEQRVLLENLEACSSPRTCPHGRPTMIHISLELMQRQFGRRGSR